MGLHAPGRWLARSRPSGTGPPGQLEGPRLSAKATTLVGPRSRGHRLFLASYGGLTFLCCAFCGDGLAGAVVEGPHIMGMEPVRPLWAPEVNEGIELVRPFLAPEVCAAFGVQTESHDPVAVGIGGRRSPQLYRVQGA